jgi:predicted component of type VI protein secretion system
MLTVEIHLDDRKVMSVPFDKSRLVIGRADDSDIALKERDVSRRHVALVRRDDTILVLDIGSRFGTYLNDERVPPNDPYPLDPGDVIRVGSYSIEVQGLERLGELMVAAAAPPPPLPALSRATIPAIASAATVRAALDSATPSSDAPDIDDLADLDEPGAKRSGGALGFLLLLLFLGVGAGLLYAYFTFFQIQH